MAVPINPDATNLEEAFFAKENAKLLQELRKRASEQLRRAALREAAPNADDALIDRLIALGIGPETVLAMVLVPLIAVAWADGHIDESERKAILRAAKERGVEPGSPGGQLLESWLAERPGPEVLAAWKSYMRSTWSAFSESERQAMRERMIGMAEGVAEAAGGFLGIGAISAAERKMIEELTQALP